jgi:hypothetical protein
VRQQEPLRTVSEDERAVLGHLSRSAREQAAVVARAKAVLAVADGASYTAAAPVAGRRSGDAVARLVARFHVARLNTEGLDALIPRHGGGRQAVYSRSIQGASASGSSVRLDASQSRSALGPPPGPW